MCFKAGALVGLLGVWAGLLVSDGFGGEFGGVLVVFLEFWVFALLRRLLVGLV